MNRKDRAFSLIELVVGILILTLVSGGVWRLFFSGYKGAQHGHESSDQTYAAAVILKSLEKDMWNLLPEDHFSSSLPIGGPVELEPGKISFWVMEQGPPQKIRYSFFDPNPGDKIPGEIRREKLDSTGNPVKMNAFGGGLVASFSPVDVDGTGNCFKVEIIMEGKQKRNVFSRVFSGGYYSKMEAKNWVFEY